MLIEWDCMYCKVTRVIIISNSTLQEFEIVQTVIIQIQICNSRPVLGTSGGVVGGIKKLYALDTSVDADPATIMSNSASVCCTAGGRRLGGTGAAKRQ